MKTKFTKFLTIGAFSIMGLASMPADAQTHSEQGSILMASDNLIELQEVGENISNTPTKISIDVSSTVKNKDKLKNLLKFKSIENWINSNTNNGYMPKNLNINYKDIANINNSEGFADSNDGCKISISGNDFRQELFEKSPLAKNIILNEKQKQLMFEFTLFHEISHCIFREIGGKDHINIGEDIVSATLKNFFDEFSHDQYSSGKDEKEVTPIALFNEQFSDVYSTILLIKKNGLSNDVLQLLKYIEVNRIEGSKRIIKEKNIPLESHSTGFALKEILKEENLNIILDKNNNVNHHLDLAINTTNKALEKTLVDYDFIKSETFSMDGIEFKVRAYLFDHIFLDRDEGKGIYGSTTPLRDIAYEAFLEINEKYNVDKISSDKLQGFYNDNKKDIQAICKKYLNSYITSFNANYGVENNDILEPIRKHLSSIQKQDIPTEENLSTSINIAKNINTKDILKNIADIRKKSLSNNVQSNNFGKNSP